MPGNEHVFRIDRFVVPNEYEAELLAAIAATNAAFEGMVGCLQRHVLRQDGPSGYSAILTFVEWESPAAIAKAREAVAERHRQMKIDPPALFKRLNISAELGTYLPL